MDRAQVAYCKVFPGIGIARVGNSPEEFIIGPEIPNSPPLPEEDEESIDGCNGRLVFKDAEGRIKRQAARFRVYAFDTDGNAVGEVTASDATITWTVELANRKAAWYQFDGASSVYEILGGDTVPDRLRNRRRQGNLPPEERTNLIIGPTERSVSSEDECSEPFTGRIFELDEPVYLGELRIDADGRLLVLGGRGVSKSVRDQNSLKHYANNDDWFDDTADGPVRATLKWNDGTDIPVHGRSWVIVAPPNYSPYTENIVSGYDAIVDSLLRHDVDWPENELGPKPRVDHVSFTEDVFPILSRLVRYQWINQRAQRGHGAGRPGNFLAEDPSTGRRPTLEKLADPREASKPDSLAKRIFGKIRNPNLQKWSSEARAQANLYYMPPLSGDEGDAAHGNAYKWLTLTATQYEKLRLWQLGQFEADWNGIPEAPQSIEDVEDVGRQPFLLTRAALEACEGGAFYPGIEITAILRYEEFYSEAFRVADDLEAGDITKWMALPWQGDFYECNTHWWPAKRPDDVIPEEEFLDVLNGFPRERDEKKLTGLLLERRPWDRGVGLEVIPKPPSLLIPYPTPNPKDFDLTWDVFLPEPTAAERDDGFLKEVYFDRVRDDIEKYVGGMFRLFRIKFALRQSQLDALAKDGVSPVVCAKLRSIAALSFGSDARFLAKLQFVLSPEELQQNRDRVLRRASENAETEKEYHGRIQRLLEGEWSRRRRHVAKNDMVSRWNRLGFVAERITPAGEVLLVETERTKYEGLRDRDYFYLLLNYHAFPDFHDTAKALADKFLEGARQFVKTARFRHEYPLYAYFAYSSETFNARLDQIYESLRADSEAYDAEKDPVVTTRERFVMRLLQLAPFNQTDGAWLRFVANTGPIDEVHSLLFDIWMDETGNGDPALNHANIYTDLLHSLGIYLPEINTRAYAEHPDLLDSAFTGPVFQLLMSQFSEEYLPEILGMTLQLEWEVLSLWIGVKRAKRFGINPMFYTMHIGIDNAAHGHGALAKRAVELYLDHVRRESGESEVQNQWRRIWNGYVAFATTGDVGSDLAYSYQYPKTPDDKMMELLRRKKRVAQLNHGTKTLGPNYLNEWFEDPEQFLEELQKHTSVRTPGKLLVKAGKPEESAFFDLVAISGPMYKVFSEAELVLWADWIRSLAPQAGQPTPIPTPPDPGAAMVALLLKKRLVGEEELAHQGYKLIGPDPENAGQDLTLPVASWFARKPEEMMRALKDSRNGWIVPGNAGASSFVNQLLSGERRMGRALAETFPEIGGKTGKEVIVDWINANCPIPGEGPPAAPVGILTFALPPYLRGRDETVVPSPKTLRPAGIRLWQRTKGPGAGQLH